ncbi:MAG: hypothetical protein JSU70_18760 [Phycisphaerales bacterium]|nr:MAG: hypothetical protein JSU70_18760 [Phycisphaerales bacterium]
MLNRIACVIVLMVGASLVGSCAAATNKTDGRIDAHTLLADLKEMIKETPETKQKCQEMLENIRAWREKSWKQLQGQSVSPKYGFEYQWKPQTYEDSMACTQALFSDERHVEGNCSLKMMMDLVGGHKRRSKGEVWVDMRDHPPVGEHVPVNMLGHTVAASIYAPWRARGKPDKPNGFQVFVKDKDYRSQYGPWHNVREAEWFKISLNVSPFAPRGGHMDSGFDPTQIIVVGVAMGAGGGSKATYKGPVYVDGVDWQ